MYEVEHFLKVTNYTGESPQWNVEEQALYWVDLHRGNIYRYWPSKGTYEVFVLGVEVGAMCSRDSGGLILATSNGIAFWDSKTTQLDYVAKTDLQGGKTRFNDGKVDPQGRFWAGTQIQGGTEPVNALYRFDPDGTLHTMETEVILSNGLGWSPDSKTMYYNDSGRNVMYAYDFDPASGNISNRRVFHQFPSGEIIPDGLTVDSEGYIWCVMFRGYKIIRFSPSGAIDCEIRMPTRYTTSCIFGGENMDELYITTGWREDCETRAAFDGDLFRIKTNVKARPEPKFAG